MARGHKYFPGGYRYEVDISIGGMRRAADGVKAFEGGLAERAEEFTRLMAEAGLEFARARVLEYDAIDTRELFSSLDVRPGDAAFTGSSWIIYTECGHAQYVEFGTGPKGGGSPHPSGHGKYRSTGWAYYDDAAGRTRWTRGMPARPFMWDTWMHLRSADAVRRIAKEVFG